MPAGRISCPSVREALKRLQQSRLVSVRHGGTSHVLDYRDSAGLDLLAELIVTPVGRFDTQVVRGIIEMRSALAPDIARLAAERVKPAQSEALERCVAAMERQEYLFSRIVTVYGGSQQMQLDTIAKQILRLP